MDFNKATKLSNKKSKMLLKIINEMLKIIIGNVQLHYTFILLQNITFDYNYSF